MADSFFHILNILALLFSLLVDNFVNAIVYSILQFFL
jgi:hypothetical protein